MGNEAEENCTYLKSKVYSNMMKKTSVSNQEFKDVFNLDIDSDLEQVAISSLKKQHSLQDDEAEQYFDMLVAENEINPSDEEVWEQLKANEKRST